MNESATNCPKCGAPVDAEGIGGHSVGQQPIHQHATCDNCGAKLTKNVGDVWREEKP
jgi:transposase-like protein